MNDTLFNESNLLYRLLDLEPEVFSLNPEELLAKLKSLKRGMPVENEFIALCLWMEKCKLIHKLDQDQLPKESTQDYQVVDLLAIFEKKGIDIPVLIEVKSTEKPKLNFSKKYFMKLKNYANMLGLPLLIAWKIKSLNTWLLIDFNIITINKTAYQIDFEKAMINNLLSCLAGDFSIHLNPGISFTFKIHKDMVLKQNISKQEFLGTIRESYLRNTKGEKITNVPFVFLYTFLLTQYDERYEEAGDSIIYNLTLLPDKGQMFFASNLLDLALAGTVLKQSEIKWFEVFTNLKYKFKFSDLNKSMLESRTHGLTSMIGRITPGTIPDFLQTMV